MDCMARQGKLKLKSKKHLYAKLFQEGRVLVSNCGLKDVDAIRKYITRKGYMPHQKKISDGVYVFWVESVIIDVNG